MLGGVPVNQGFDQRPRSQLVTTHLLRRETIGNSYHVLTFENSQSEPAQPGQFTMIRSPEWGQAPLLSRPMSYLSGGTTPSLLVKVCGEGSARLGRAEAGEPFQLLGPLGTGWRPANLARKQVLVAGGVGIAPLLFLARTIARDNHRPILLYGGRSNRDLPLADDAAEFCEVRLATEDGSSGHVGRVTELLADCVDDQTEVYTCGPNAMMAAVATYCAGVQVACEVSLEAPMACGYGVCLGCAVPASEGGYMYACVKGPCVESSTVDWQRIQTFTAPPLGKGQTR
jgi:dihydroorotate dehydrogenase electron transfer subunit